jgi:hypothetical protein
MRRLAVKLALALPFVACVVETEPGPRKPLLRDTLRAQASASASAVRIVASAVPVPLPVPAPAPDAFQACETTADCVAILPNACCQDGRNVAMNRALVDAYRSSFRCPTEHPLCPTELVLDRRVASCDGATHLCKLVDAPP